MLRIVAVGTNPPLVSAANANDIELSRSYMSKYK